MLGKAGRERKMQISVFYDADKRDDRYQTATVKDTDWHIKFLIKGWVLLCVTFLALHHTK